MITFWQPHQPFGWLCFVIFICCHSQTCGQEGFKCLHLPVMVRCSQSCVSFDLVTYFSVLYREWGFVTGLSFAAGLYTMLTQLRQQYPSTLVFRWLTFTSIHCALISSPQHSAVVNSIKYLHYNQRELEWQPEPSWSWWKTQLQL